MTPSVRFVAAVAVLLLLAGCTRSPEPPPALVDLRLATYEGVQDPLLDSLLAAYAEGHKNVRVVKVPIPAAPDSNTLRRMVREQTIDIFPTGHATWWLGDAPDTALDLLTFVQKSRMDLQVYESARDELYRNGRLLALPITVQPHVVVYSKALTDAAGVAMPTERWTWDQFRELAIRLSRGEGSKRTYGFYAYRQTTALLPARVEQALQPGVGLSEEAAVRDSIAFFAELMGAGAVPVEPSDGTTVNYWQLKQAAMTLFSMNELLRFQPFPADLEILPLPTLPGAKPIATAFVNAYSISPAGKHPDEAWDLLSFLSGPEAAKLIATAGVLPFHMTEDAKQSFLAASPRLPRSVSATLDAKWVIMPTYAAKSRTAALWDAAFTILTGGTQDQAIARYETMRKQ